jgi:hypothetical protein
METEYCGWPNKQTWIVNLWMGNDGLHKSFSELARELIESNSDSATRDLAVHIQDYFVEKMPEVNMFWHFMLQSSLAFVYWYEIAASIVDEIVDDDSDDDDFIWLQ